MKKLLKLLKILTKETSLKKAEKPDLISSGSLELKESIASEQTSPAPSDDAKKNVEEVASDLFKQILDATMIDSLMQESFAESSCIVQSEDGKPLWLLSLTSKSFKRIHNKSEITMLEKIDENISHCMIHNDLYEVKNELIKDIGWN